MQRAQVLVSMDAPTSRLQLLQTLHELFPGDVNAVFRADAAAAIDKMSTDWSAALLGMPVGDRKLAIKAAVRDHVESDAWRDMMQRLNKWSDDMVS
ncbi:hypothetical protein MNEG_0820 [Monoraphidium neglectum]|uniref:Uncharacterized protein n=1 Tax=Monoraphidium neglectum TaxID=145388 RepID=A0A0D2NS97_9CHLO|nr:hypothetical protein MNEG_0820 [Monoraphidium neglectum]KIZ07136.1 hypothetical protein MNEG_0820 [Monoraphidium neglectum]|eukprot:XP_013906155.1 hypothetical protein MNEG_0820 [Monoraphidium neglectum]